MENGPSSTYAPCFDIDWEPVNPVLRHKVLLPVLSEQFGAALEKGHIRLVYEQGAFHIAYSALRLPIAPRTCLPLLEHQLERLAGQLGADHADVQELRSLMTSLGHLPPHDERAAEKIAERQREKEVIKRRYVTLCAASAAVRETLEETVRTFNGTVGDPRSFDRLEALLNEQAYRLTYWRVATEEVNYRRFFDINELAALCTENPLVFQATHQLVLRLLAEGRVCGLRIDHPDGLWNPTEYFQRLQDEYVLAYVRARLPREHTPDDVAQRVATRFAEERAAGSAPGGGWPLWVVAEKILGAGEPLPADWAIAGTTGYDFLNLVNGLFVAPQAADAFTHLYAEFTETAQDFAELAERCKKMIMLVSMAGEINALSHQLDRISERNRQYRDFTLNSLTFVIREIIASLQVYRAYVTGPDHVSVRDRRCVEDAVAHARRINPRTPASIFNFVRDTLLLDNLNQFRLEDRPQVSAWVMKFQQLTGPIMAKGVEDTAFYVFHRLVSLNEVGGHPDQFGVAVAEFHEANAARARHWPQTMLATATHDTKRSEDLRARLNVLSEMPAQWQAALHRWSPMNAAHKTVVDDAPAPDRNDEYLLYQTLLGVWPDEPLDAAGLAVFRDRITAYMEKATREAKVHTSWINPHAAYDAAVRDFVHRLLPDDPTDPFRADLEQFRRPLAFFGRINSLAQTVLKITCPGLPDFYQGTEFWSLQLVDPDNRRSVDFASRHTALVELQQRARERQPLPALLAELLASAENGRVKLYVIQALLEFRRQQPELFERGEYVPLDVIGQCVDHVCAFSRSWDGQQIVVIVPRLVATLMEHRAEWPLGAGVWKDTQVILPHVEPGTAWVNGLTGETVRMDGLPEQAGLSLGRVLQSFPVAFLTPSPNAAGGGGR